MHKYARKEQQVANALIASAFLWFIFVHHFVVVKIKDPLASNLIHSFISKRLVGRWLVVVFI
eukprot:m.352811 g.352811  ORF g.352811 m.352811 type:complete len:62 (+) comp16615_c0_seq1:1985-2170(+)